MESGYDVVDGEVDGDVLDADGGAQLCDDALVDLAGDLVDALAVADGEGERSMTAVRPRTPIAAWGARWPRVAFSASSVIWP